MNKPIVCVSGGFDPVHKGHIELFQEAAEFGIVKVLLNSDKWLSAKKGKPFMTWEHRASILNCIYPVNEVISFNDDDGSACDGLKTIKEKYPNQQIFFANGGDRKKDNTPEQLFCEENGIGLLWGIGGNKVASSSDLLTNHFHKLVKRKWGLWTVLKGYDTRVKVKELVIYPEEEISYQRHFKRSELWFVVRGNPIFIKNNEASKMKPHDIFIVKTEDWHQIKNPSSHEPVHIIEIQYGSYCDERDIERKN